MKESSKSKAHYEQKALLYAERYGIVNYMVKGNTMTYTEEFPLEKRKMRATVNLDTMKETRKEIGGMK